MVEKHMTPGMDVKGNQNLKPSQSDVDAKFLMLVPIYLEMDDGRIFFLARAHMAGNTTIDQKVPLRGVKTKPKRAIVNYYDDVLASVN